MVTDTCLQVPSSFMLPCSWYFAASASPVPTAHCAPTIPLPPKKFAERRYLTKVVSNRRVEGAAAAHVHGAAFALGATGCAASELSENTLHSIASPNLSAMVAVGSNKVVLLGQHRLHARRYGFLAVIQVAEASDGLPFVHPEKFQGNSVTKSERAGTHMSATSSMRRMSDMSLKNASASSRVVVISAGIFSVSKWYLTGGRVHVTVLSFLFNCKHHHGELPKSSARIHTRHTLKLSPPATAAENNRAEPGTKALDKRERESMAIGRRDDRSD